MTPRRLIREAKLKYLLSEELKYSLHCITYELKRKKENRCCFEAHSNFTCAEPNTLYKVDPVLSSTVDSDGRTLHVPNLTGGEKKYHPYCLKQGK